MTRRRWRNPLLLKTGGMLSMTAPLEGLRVVEVASFVAAPAAGALLADLGAEVIKVEVPQGEIYRYALPRFLGVGDCDFPEAPPFHMDNRGKRSLALDVTLPAARAALLRVIDGADIVLTNMLPDRLRKYGFDAASLHARKPGLIFASVNGYGPQGAEASNPAFDYVAYWARTGFMDIMHEPDAPPAFQRPGIGDHSAALALVTGILAALRVRDRTGEGQVIQVSLMGIGFYIQGNDAALTLVAKQSPRRHDRRRPMNPLWNHYATKDGRWLFLAMIDSDRYWPRLCAALGRREISDDQRFASHLSRMGFGTELAEILCEVFGSRPLAEWEPLLNASGAIWAPVRTLAEAIEDPQARANGMFCQVAHPTLGTFESVGPPLQMSGHQMPADRPAPALGADGETILREAGLTAEEIAEAIGKKST
jgi:crotonobetainyl-CoA:carnitine CoA-transferase CaiB-like acyl-CoA transferase